MEVGKVFADCLKIFTKAKSFSGFGKKLQKTLEGRFFFFFFFFFFFLGGGVGSKLKK